MGKVFITDEVNDNYTAKVLSTGSITVMPNNNSYIYLGSAASSSSVAISSAPCWLHAVTIGSSPGTATSLIFYDTSASAASASTTNRISRLVIPIASIGVSAGTDQFPRTILYDLYCSTGLTYGFGQDGALGNLNGITVTYRT